MTSESFATEAASTGQLLRRYRKLAGLTAQELAHEINSRHPDDAITATVIFNIEAERKTAITVPELAHFAEVLAISPIQLLCDCDQPYLPARSGAFQGRTARQVIEEFTLPREPRNDAPTPVIATALDLEENLRSILNLGDGMHDMPGMTDPAMTDVTCQLAMIRRHMLANQIRQLQDANVRLPDRTSDAVDKARQILRRLELKATKSSNGSAGDNRSMPLRGMGPDSDFVGAEPTEDTNYVYEYLLRNGGAALQRDVVKMLGKTPGGRKPSNRANAVRRHKNDLGLDVFKLTGVLRGPSVWRLKSMCRTRRKAEELIFKRNPGLAARRTKGR